MFSVCWVCVCVCATKQESEEGRPCGDSAAKEAVAGHAKSARNRRARAETRAAKASSLRALSLAELDLLVAPSGGQVPPTPRNKYHAVVMAWRRLFLPALARILTSDSRDVRLKGALYVLRCVLRLDPLCLVHLLTAIQSLEFTGDADDALTPDDRRLWGFFQVPIVALATMAAGWCLAACAFLNLHQESVCERVRTCLACPGAKDQQRPGLSG